MNTPHQPQPHTDGWQEIGTAPKDGSYIIGRLANGEVFRVSWHLFGKPGWFAASDIGFVTPKYWMPMPKEPFSGVAFARPSTTQSHIGEAE